MRTTNAFEWTERRCLALAAGWEIGLSAAQLASVIGCTRNAVIGKAHRMGLPGRGVVRTEAQRQVLVEASRESCGSGVGVVMLA